MRWCDGTLDEPTLDRTVVTPYDAGMSNVAVANWFYFYFTPPAPLVGLLAIDQ
jgi:hypothetical protein